MEDRARLGFTAFGGRDGVGMTKRKRLQFHPRDETMIVIGAFRYYLGRMTITVSGFCDWLCMNWVNLEEGTRNIIIREIEDAYQRDEDDRARAAEEGKDRSWFPLGMDCDKAQWAWVHQPICLLRRCK